MTMNTVRSTLLAVELLMIRGVPIIGSADISATDMAFSTNIGIGTKQ